MGDDKVTREHLSNIEDLLIQQIAAANRTTRAVRAFVRFLFIQLVAITLAFFVVVAGDLFRDTSECDFGVCGPNTGAQIFAGFIWLVGVIWSSSAGWSELSSSEVPALPVRRKNSETLAKYKNATMDSRSESDDSDEQQERLERKTRGTQKRGRFCTNCGAALGQYDIACQACDTRQAV